MAEHEGPRGKLRGLLLGDEGSVWCFEKLGTSGGWEMGS